MTWATNWTKFNEGISRTISSRCLALAKVRKRFAFRSPVESYRVIYVARRLEAVYVLHAFQKKTQATPKKDLEIAKQRFGMLKGGEI